MTRPDDIRDLLNNMAAQEAQARETTFLAPCVCGGRVRTRLAGIVQTFMPRPRDFEGWGIFRPANERTAALVEEADLPLVENYLELLKPLRVRLVHALHGRTWLAYPVNEADARQRLGAVRPLVIHLVTDARNFAQVLVRWDGQVCWFADENRRADPALVESLNSALMQVEAAADLRFPGMTPEMRTAYALALQNESAFNAVMAQRYSSDAPIPPNVQERLDQHQDETRLRQALGAAGGGLSSFADRGDFWQVEWTTRDGVTRRSAIGKRDLTVLSSGICLSGEDEKFDLQSLVGVIEKRQPSYWDDEY